MWADWWLDTFFFNILPNIDNLIQSGRKMFRFVGWQQQQLRPCQKENITRTIPRHAEGTTSDTVYKIKLFQIKCT